ncbi:hypothetical protein JCGZ_03741 [Jatropha curcas]|uniref:Uncharacterized protein n=1 Tax=Jatropha curcas TaxID=180498 RepID=A0A067JFN0_JATCU|nr:hypothetical protein JCGZ_03741 [Jatropha curcas]
MAQSSTEAADNHHGAAYPLFMSKVTIAQSGAFQIKLSRMAHPSRPIWRIQAVPSGTPKLAK